MSHNAPVIYCPNPLFQGRPDNTEWLWFRRKSSCSDYLSKVTVTEVPVLC